jgi:hypothetical protein
VACCLVASLASLIAACEDRRPAPAPGVQQPVPASRPGRWSCRSRRSTSTASVDHPLGHLITRHTLPTDHLFILRIDAGNHQWTNARPFARLVTYGHEGLRGRGRSGVQAVYPTDVHVFVLCGPPDSHGADGGRRHHHRRTSARHHGLRIRRRPGRRQRQLGPRSSQPVPVRQQRLVARRRTAEVLRRCATGAALRPGPAHRRRP